MTMIFTHPVFAQHETPPGHPEQSARMGAVERALSADGLADLPRRESELVAIEAITRVHPERYVDRLVASMPTSGMVSFDPDTHAGPHSWDAARRAAGAACAAVDAVIGGEADNAFVASRPPGHHAEQTRAMGFCLINHIAIAARHAKAAHGVERVAIVDYDVHHGNGTQDIFEENPSVLFISTHQSPLYPGTGAASETGVGNIVNLPLPAGTGGRSYRPVFTHSVVSRVEEFAPDLILLSSGFDAHADDPLAGMMLVEDDFVWITEQIRTVADKHCGGRIVSILEGGYDLAALGRSAAAHVKALAA